MIYEFFRDHGSDTSSLALTAVLLLLACLVILTLTSVLSQSVLPGVPRLNGYPVLGAIPIYFRDGMALMLETLTTLGDDGIAYAQVGNKTLVSVHDPIMAKEVLAFPDDIASRQVYRPGFLYTRTDRAQTW